MAICCKIMKALAVVLLATPYIASQSPELNTTLYSTIDGTYVAFSNENITFTCIARGTVSSHIGWTSEQYIGMGGRRLEFIAANSPGTTRMMGFSVAVLVDAAVDDFIISRLYIRIQPTIPMASVQCLNIDAGTTTSITFRLAEGDTSVRCDKQSVCPGEDVNCVCTTGNSNTLAWTVNQFEFTSNDRLLTRRDVNAFGTLTDRYNRSEIQIITSNLTVTASMDDTSLPIQCENVDRSSSNLATIIVLQDCDAVTTSPVTVQPAPTVDRGASIGLSIAIAALVVGCFALILILAFGGWKLFSKIQEKKIDIANKKVTIEILKSDNDKMNEIIMKLESENESLRNEVEEKDDKIAKLEKEVKEKKGEITKLEKEVKEKKGEITKLRKEVKENKETITKLERKVGDKIADLENGKRRNEEKDKEIQNLKKDKQNLIWQLQQKQEVEELSYGRGTGPRGQ